MRNSAGCVERCTWPRAGTIVPIVFTVKFVRLALVYDAKSNTVKFVRLANYEWYTTYE